MTTKNLPGLLSFQDRDIQFVEVNGEFCLTAEEIGRGLGYQNPRESIIHIYNRFRDELEPYTGVTKLITPGGIQEVRVFTEEGIYIISMLARTARAREFRRRVAGLLKELRQRRLQEARLQGARAVYALEETLKRSPYDRGFLRAMVRYRRMGLTQRETAKLLDCSRETVQRYEKLLKQSGLWEVL